MIQYHDNVRDYIKRNREKRAQEQQPKKRKIDFESIILTLIGVSLMSIMIYNIPEALDQMWYQQYEKPMEYIHELEAQQRIEDIKNGVVIGE